MRTAIVYAAAKSSLKTALEHARGGSSLAPRAAAFLDSLRNGGRRDLRAWWQTMQERFQRLSINELAIDLGTANTVIYTRTDGIVLNEPSVVAIRGNHGGESIAAVGTQAKRMLGRVPGELRIVRPLRQGVVADFSVTEKMFQYFLRRVLQNSMLRPSPRILVGVPCGATQVERRAIREAAGRAGARDVYLIDEPLAAGLGAGLPVHEPRGSMILDIGGGTSEIAVVALNGIVYANSLRTGGDHFDEAIIGYVRRNYGTLIGEATAERIKLEIGSAYPGPRLLETEATGRNLSGGVPHSFTLNSNEVLSALHEPLLAILDATRAALEHTPPELAADVMENGIVLTGGGALLRGLDRLIQEETGVPVQVDENPLTSVARGAGEALNLLNGKASDLISRD